MVFVILACSNKQVGAQDTLSVYKPESKVFAPDPVRATMLAVSLPGLGQIYNRKYWKVPIVYAGFGAVAYSIGFFSSCHNQYLVAYQDLTDDVRETQSYVDIIPTDPSYYDRMQYPNSYNPSIEAQYKDALLKKVDYFKKYRDFSYIGIGLWYLLTILDAHVDACLFNYDISDNLGVEIVPLASTTSYQLQSGVSLKFTF